jgi:hypothetical protein|uniref:Uncharacterized protein n=1 Tax=viral metagenome TaxID=1070528 RepID=A0A6C0ALQ9_9ZZZZ
MVLGFILYEAVDLVWNFGGMTFRGAKGAYNWYYEVPTPDDIEIHKLEDIEKRMKHLEDLLSKDKQCIKDK